MPTPDSPETQMLRERAEEIIEQRGEDSQKRAEVMGRISTMSYAELVIEFPELETEY